jgi:hypothetical protein
VGKRFEFPIDMQRGVVIWVQRVRVRRRVFGCVDGSLGITDRQTEYVEERCWVEIRSRYSRAGFYLRGGEGRGEEDEEMMGEGKFSLCAGGLFSEKICEASEVGLPFWT